MGKASKIKSIPSNREIICVGRPTLKPIITGRVLRGVNVSNITIRGCDFDGNYGNVVSDGFFAFWSNVVGLTFEDNKITNGAGSSTITGTSQFNSFRFNTCTNNHLDCFTFSGANVKFNKAMSNKFANVNGWGIAFINGAAYNLAQGNRSNTDTGTNLEWDSILILQLWAVS